jgi:uncharacterized protein YdaU (DUF1376 family)
MRMSNARKGRAPAFQFYAADFLADENVMAMTLEERGAYITLMAVEWREGSIPAEPKRLARIVGATLAEFEAIWGILGECFVEGEPGRLVHPRLERERGKQAAHRERQSQAGKEGAEKRWGKAPDDKGKDRVAIATPIGLPSPNDGVGVALQSAVCCLQSATTTPPTPSKPEPKASAGNGEPCGFAEFWAAKPKRAGSNPRPRALKAYRARLKAGAEPAEILEGVKRYHRFCEITGKLGTEYVMQAATFVGPDERWSEAWTPPPDTKPSPGSQAATVGEAPSHANRPRPTTASVPSRPGEDPEAEERRRREEIERADAWGRKHPEQANAIMLEIQEEAGGRLNGLPEATARAAVLGEFRRRVLDEVLKPKALEWAG